MSVIESVINEAEQKPEFFSTGNWQQDISTINDWIKRHPEEYVQEDKVQPNGDILCRSRLVLHPFIIGDGEGYAYILYNKSGVEVGFKHLDVYNP